MAIGNVFTEEIKTHTEMASSNHREYTIEMGGTIDGSMTRDPMGYGTWDQNWDERFESNVSVRIENIGDVDVINPWIIAKGKRNWRTIEDIIAEATQGLSTDKEKAYAVYKFVIDHRHHTTTGDNENTDPVKVFNMYGYALCGNTAQFIHAMWRTAGLRVRRCYLQGHEVAEVFYDGKYHLFDADESIFSLLRDNETVASEAEVVQDHDLLKRTHTYSICCDDSRGDDEYSASFYVYEGHREGENFPKVGHKMYFTLRPGEALEWRWESRGSYHGRSDYSNNKNIHARIYNGRMFYKPRLPDVSRQHGTVWELRSPYVIVGAKVKAAGKDCKLLMSFDRKEWKEIFSFKGLKETEINLKDEFPHRGKARYKYFIKLEAARRKGLTSIRFESVLQMAPLSLPGLCVGQNRITYFDETKRPHNVKITHTWRESSASYPPSAPPKPIFPEDGGRAHSMQFAFKWKEPVDKDGDSMMDYHFQLSNRSDMRWSLSPNFNRRISYTKDKGKARFTLPYKGLLNPGQTYYWRVRAKDGKGVWGKWSSTWSFTMPDGPWTPEIIYKWQPNYRCDKVDFEKRTLTLRWRPSERGTKPVKYRIYGSDERGFTVSDKPYKVLWRNIQWEICKKLGVKYKREFKEFPSNFVCVTTKTELTVAGPDVKLPNANKAYYRIVAVGKNGIESTPSDQAPFQRPFIYTLPETSIRAGKKWEYQVKVIKSIGDLQCRDFVPEEYTYNAWYWDVDQPCFYLFSAPSWVKIDENTGMVSGTPDKKGTHSFLVYVNIPKVGCDSQFIELEVKEK